MSLSIPNIGRQQRRELAEHFVFVACAHTNREEISSGGRRGARDKRDSDARKILITWVVGIVRLDRNPLDVVANAVTRSFNTAVS